MINPEVHLTETLFDNPAMSATRDGFGVGIVEAARQDSRVVLLCADLSESTRAEAFANEFPTRFVEAGIAEQNMAALAAGMAAVGKKPFIASYAMFNCGRNWEQIRTTIALNRMPVVVCGMHAGVSVGPDGATHQALEDIALMRVIPGMTVISPCDAEEARKATLVSAASDGPVYIRFGREKTPVMTSAETPFAIGEAQRFLSADNPKAVIFATGPLLYNALVAAKQMGDSGVGVNVVNVSTVKPLDRDTILREASLAGAVVTVEEHQVAGGLGGAIAELLAAESSLPVEFIGVHDQFGQSGEPKELFEHYGMGISHIVAAVQKAIARKR